MVLALVCAIAGAVPVRALDTSPPARVITIATGEFPPWSGAQLPNHGYVNHIIAEAFASQGVAVTFVYQPWKRAFEEARRGQYDATSFWYANAEREATMLLSDPVIRNRTVFFQRADMPPIRWQTLADLAPYRLSTTVGFTYSEAFLDAIAIGTLQAMAVTTDIQNLKLLMARRVDLFATDEMTGYSMAAELQVDPRKLRVVEPALREMQGHLMISKIHPDAARLLAIFNRGLQTIIASGRYRQIVSRIDNSSFYYPGVDLAPGLIPAGSPPD